MCPNMKLFDMKFRRILEVFALRGAWKSSAQFHDLCVQKRSCLPWSWDALRKLSPCEAYRKNFGRNFTNYASKNEAVCREVQTHFGSSPFARFTEKVLGAISRFMRLKRSCLLWSSDAFWKFLLCEVHEKALGAISRFMRPKTKLFAVK